VSRPPLEFRRRLIFSLVATNLGAGFLVLVYFDLAVSPVKGGSHLSQVLGSFAGFVILTAVVVPVTARKALRVTDPQGTWSIVAVAVVAAGHGRPGVLFMTVPQGHQALLPDILLVLKSVRSAH